MSRFGARLAGKERQTSAAEEQFWALRDISFTISEGEVVGLIGPNGSGKSTLLKIISRITAPTVGEVRLNGRVGSLLEVGTGFHPELSGRENVFLNGAILGMRQREIRAKFEEIVAFAGVERFIDTPVKRYSSGMQMRLAFSVAAHLDTDILFVDEVLAVGDAEFQQKCLGKMHDTARSGRTVLFVSHNMSSIKQLCGRVLWLDRGRLVEDTVDVFHAVGRLLAGSDDASAEAVWLAPRDGSFETDSVSLREFRACDRDGRVALGAVGPDRQLQVEIGLELRRMEKDLAFGYALVTEAGEPVLTSLTTDAGVVSSPRLAPGANKLVCEFPNRMLNEGRYKVEFLCRAHHQWLSEPLRPVASITVELASGARGYDIPESVRPGILAPVYVWHRAGAPVCDAFEAATGP